jgi:endo-1,4-beta-xylanase
MAFDVFISYSSQDKTAADAACAVLEGAGIRCWIAPRDIRAGTEYGGSIIDAIDHCRAMILVFSSSANESRQIRREIERAVAKGVPILPVRIEEVTPTQSMEYFLGAIHWLDALSPPIEQHLQRLAETVKAMLKLDADAPGRPAGDTVHGASAPQALGETRAPARPAANAQPPSARSVTATKPARPSWLVPVIGAAALAVLIAVGFSLYRLGAVSTASVPAPTAPPATLRAAAQAHDFLMGAAAGAQSLRIEPIYAETLAHEYNVVITENEMRFGRVRPSRTEFNFNDPDAIVEFASAHGLKVYGQPLVWYGELSPWLANGNFPPSEVSAILKDHIQTMVRHYRGRVYAWDVVWEVFDNLGKMGNSLWAKALGPDYVEQAFAWAREADPQVKLFWREHHGFEPLGAHADATYELARKFRARGVLIDGIAVGSPLLVDRLPKLPDLVAHLSRLAALGLEVYLADFEVSVPLPASDESLQKQAALYRDYLSACLSIAGCKGFFTWGFTDKHSWAPYRWQGMGVGAAMPFDAGYKPKPAVKAMLDVLSGQEGSAR